MDTMERKEDGAAVGTTSRWGRLCDGDGGAVGICGKKAVRILAGVRKVIRGLVGRRVIRGLMGWWARVIFQ